MGRENRPMHGKLLSLRKPSAEEREEGDTGYVTCPSRRIGHEGPDVPLQCSLFSLIDALGIALQHTLYVYLHPHSLLTTLLMSRHSGLSNVECRKPTKASVVVM